MKNVLIDQNCKWLANEDSKKYLINYEHVFVVGKDLKQRDYDELFLLSLLISFESITVVFCIRLPSILIL